MLQLETEPAECCTCAPAPPSSGDQMKICLGLLLLVLSGTSVAGLFSGSLSDRDAGSVHKIAVLSLLGNTLYLDTVGLTVFGNNSLHVEVPQWKMDAAVMEHVVQLLQGERRFSAEELTLASDQVGWKEFGGFVGPSAAGRRSIVDQAHKQGADTVLLVVRETNPHDGTIPPGFGLHNRHLLGKDHVDLLASFAVVLIRVDGDKVLAQQHPDPLTPGPASWPIKASWDQLPSDEQSALENSLKQAVFSRVDGVLASMKLTSASLR